MDPTYIAAFVRSVRELASTMLDLSVEVSAPRVHDPSIPSNEVSAIIGLSGDCEGSVAICMSTQTASTMVSKFVGMEITPDHPDFTDGVGELANMITGGAKSRFSGNQQVSISCPSVIVGLNHRVFQQKNMPVIEIPTLTDAGPLLIVVALRSAQTAAARAAG